MSHKVLSQFLTLSALALFSQTPALAALTSLEARTVIEANLPKQISASNCSVRLQKRGSGFTLELSDDSGTIRASTSIDSKFQEISEKEGSAQIIFVDDNLTSISGRQMTTTIQLNPTGARITHVYESGVGHSRACAYQE